MLHNLALLFLIFPSDQRLQCCLWGKFAELLISKVKEPNNGDVCLIRFAKIGKYRGI